MRLSPQLWLRLPAWPAGGAAGAEEPQPGRGKRSPTDTALSTFVGQGCVFFTPLTDKSAASRSGSVVIASRSPWAILIPRWGFDFGYAHSWNRARVGTSGGMGKQLLLAPFQQDRGEEIPNHKKAWASSPPKCTSALLPPTWSEQKGDPFMAWEPVQTHLHSRLWGNRSKGTPGSDHTSELAGLWQVGRGIPTGPSPHSFHPVPLARASSKHLLGYGSPTPSPPMHMAAAPWLHHPPRSIHSL